MTAENTEPNDASAAEDLRARYLPVSRKELRRRREAELAQKRRGKPRVAKKPVTDETDTDETGTALESGADAAGVKDTTPGADVEADTALESGTVPEAAVETGTAPEFTTGSESGPGTAEAPVADWEFSLPAPEASDSSFASVPEAAAADDLTSGQDAQAHTATEASPPETSSPAELHAALAQDLPDTERDDQDDAPVPASRRARRSLQVDETIATLSEDRFEELQELTAALVASDDPHRVDPELLKKQQALAARAMQANQERLQKEQLDADLDPEQPQQLTESPLITSKTLRSDPDSDETADSIHRPTGSIEPVKAQGAHGLEMDAMVEHSTRQGARQSMIVWLVIILAVLLIIAVGVVLSFIL